jgi:hypothetical protein
LLPNCANGECCIVTMPPQTRKLNGRSSMLLREHNPIDSFRNKASNLTAF